MVTEKLNFSSYLIVINYFKTSRVHFSVTQPCFGRTFFFNAANVSVQIEMCYVKHPLNFKELAP